METIDNFSLCEWLENNKHNIGERNLWQVKPFVYVYFLSNFPLFKYLIMGVFLSLVQNAPRTVYSHSANGIHKGFIGTNKLFLFFRNLYVLKIFSNRLILLN
jgi:hypothetical protein